MSNGEAQTTGEFLKDCQMKMCHDVAHLMAVECENEVQKVITELILEGRHDCAERLRKILNTK